MMKITAITQVYKYCANDEIAKKPEKGAYSH